MNEETFCAQRRILSAAVQIALAVSWDCARDGRNWSPEVGMETSNQPGALLERVVQNLRNSSLKGPRVERAPERAIHCRLVNRGFRDFAGGGGGGGGVAFLRSSGDAARRRRL